MEYSKARKLAEIIVRLRIRRVTDEERAYLNDWLDESEANRQTYKRVVRGEALARRLRAEEQINSEADFAAITERIARRLARGRRRLLRAVSWSAVAAVLAGVVYFSFLYEAEPEFVPYSYEPAQAAVISATPNVDSKVVLVTATGAGTAEITATANDGSGQSATCVVTVEETVVIKWNQEFEVVAGDAVRLNAEASDGAQVAFRAVKPNGGYVIPEITNDNGVWTATFANIGAVILEAYVEGLDENVECEPVRKTFNVLPDRDVMFIDGIYYRYTDNTKTALSVTYGYRQYEGDVVVPSVAGGLPVVSVGNRAFYSNAGLTSVTLPEGLERIESDQAFGNCRQLADVVLPSTVTYIGGWTFNSDNGLQEIHCGMEHPLDVEVVINGDEDIFNGFVDYDSCVLYVPYGSADEYREAEVWKNFKNIVEEQREPVLAALLSLDVNDLRLNVGETAVLKPVIYPSSAENQLVTWTSSDETVATVDAYGEVLAVGAGSAVITAATNDGSGLTAQCTVTVELPSGIDAVGCDGVRIVMENGRIVVTGLSADDEISVTTIGGALVYKGANVAVNVPRTGIYIVGIKGRFYKVAVR